MQNQFKTWFTYAILSLVSIFLSIWINTYLITDDLFYKTLSEQMPVENIENFLQVQRKYLWLGYLSIPLWILIKCGAVHLCLQVGLIMQNIKLSASRTFRIAITAETIFIIPQIIKALWYSYVQKEYSLTDLQFFYPLSLLNLFNPSEISIMWIYPLQTLNIFEFFYFIILSIGLKRSIKKDDITSNKVLFSGYLPALIIWILCVMFLSITINPSN